MAYIERYVRRNLFWISTTFKVMASFTIMIKNIIYAEFH